MVGPRLPHQYMGVITPDNLTRAFSKLLRQYHVPASFPLPCRHSRAGGNPGSRPLWNVPHSRPSSSAGCRSFPGMTVRDETLSSAASRRPCPVTPPPCPYHPSIRTIQLSNRPNPNDRNLSTPEILQPPQSFRLWRRRCRITVASQHQTPHPEPAHRPAKTTTIPPKIAIAIAHSTPMACPNPLLK